MIRINGFYEECHGIPTFIDTSDDTLGSDEDHGEYEPESYIDQDDSENSEKDDE